MPLGGLYSEPAPAPLVRGRVANTPASSSASVWVTIPSYGDPTSRWGPVVWAPKGSSFPQAGADCLVAFDDARVPWMIAWTGPSVPMTTTPSGGDDTAAINTAIAQGRQLGVGTFQVSGVINGMPRGQGATLTILLATNAAACIKHGGPMTSGPTNDMGFYGGFTFDGAHIATQPLCLSNTVGTTVLPVVLQNGLGDGLVVAGQNCTFIGAQVGQVAGCSFAMDGGAGGNLFLNFEFSGAQQYHMEFRQTFAASNYLVPTNNVFIGGRTEYGYVRPSTSDNVTTGPNAGCVHFLAASHNKFMRCDFDTPTGTRHVHAEPNTVTGRSSDYNSRNTFDDCGFGSGSASLTAGITCSSSTMNGDAECISLQGNCQWSFAAAVPAVLWTNPTNYVRQTGRYTLYNNVTKLYQASGSGTSLRYGDSLTDWTSGWTLGTNIADGGGDLGGYPLMGQVDSANMAHLTGALKVTGATATNATLATLPASLTPLRSVYLPVTIWQAGATTGTAAYMAVNSTGVLNMGSPLAAGQYVLFDGHSYPMGS